jgi:hypothetical protein
MFLISWSVFLVRPFRLSLTFADKVRSLLKGSMPERCSTKIGSRLTHKHSTWLVKLTRDKHSNLLPTFVNYGSKKFYVIETRAEYNKKITTVIYKSL